MGQAPSSHFSLHDVRRCSGISVAHMALELRILLAVGCRPRPPRQLDFCGRCSFGPNGPRRSRSPRPPPGGRHHLPLFCAHRRFRRHGPVSAVQLQPRHSFRSTPPMKAASLGRTLDSFSNSESSIPPTHRRWPYWTYAQKFTAEGMGPVAAHYGIVGVLALGVRMRASKSTCMYEQGGCCTRVGFSPRAT